MMNDTQIIVPGKPWVRVDAINVDRDYAVLHVACVGCNTVHEILPGALDLCAWIAGMKSTQEAFHDLRAWRTQMIVSGLCRVCHDSITTEGDCEGCGTEDPEELRPCDSHMLCVECWDREQGID